VLRQAGASDFKKKKAAEATICLPPAPPLPLQSSGSPSNSSSKKPKHESTGVQMLSLLRLSLHLTKN
jgi:hypothetical protein